MPEEHPDTGMWVGDLDVNEARRQLDRMTCCVNLLPNFREAALSSFADHSEHPATQYLLGASCRENAPPAETCGFLVYRCRARACSTRHRTAN